MPVLAVHLESSRSANITEAVTVVTAVTDATDVTLECSRAASAPSRNGPRRSIGPPARRLSPAANQRRARRPPARS